MTFTITQPVRSTSYAIQIKNMSLSVGQICQISALIGLYCHQIDKPGTFEDQISLHFDIIVISFFCKQTRKSNFPRIIAMFHELFPIGFFIACSKTLLCHHFVYPPSDYDNIICEMYLITKIKNIGYKKLNLTG